MTAHQRDIYSYVNMLMAGAEDASDVVQETNLDLWANMEQFDFDRPFLPWAMRFAYHRVLAYRKARSRSRLVFSDEFVNTLAEQLQRDPTRADDRVSALRKCLENLPSGQRDLIAQRYQATLSVKALAARMGAAPNNISAQLYRIRRALARCIEFRVTGEGAPS